MEEGTRVLSKQEQEALEAKVREGDGPMVGRSEPFPPGDTHGLLTITGPMSITKALQDVYAEWLRAKAKHGEQTPDGHCLPGPVKATLDEMQQQHMRGGGVFPADTELREIITGYADMRRLATLTEEVGEVGRALTYDKDHAGALRKELIQVAAMAVAWASRL